MSGEKFKKASLASWLICQVRMSATVVTEAEEMDQMGLSDHTMLVVALSAPEGGDQRRRPLPKELFADPLTKKLVLASNKWDEAMQVFQSIYFYEGIVKRASIPDLIRWSAAYILDCAFQKKISWM